MALPAARRLRGRCGRCLSNSIFRIPACPRKDNLATCKAAKYFLKKGGHIMSKDNLNSFNGSNDYVASEELMR